MNIRKWNLWTVAVLTLLTLVFTSCASNQPTGQAASAANSELLQVNDASKQQDTTMPIDVLPMNGDGKGTQLPKGSPVQILNKKKPYHLPIVDFVDEHTGFAVKEQYDVSISLLSTQDGGAHWMESGMPGEYIRSLKFVNSRTGWALVEEQCNTIDGPVICKQIRLLKTTDGGASWSTQWKAASREDRSYGNPVLNRLSFVDKENGVMLVNSSVFITRDSGAHFKKADFGVKDFKPLSFSFPKTETGYVAGASGMDDGNLLVMKTSDAGRTWTKLLEIAAEGGPMSTIGIGFTGENTGWLLTDDRGMFSGDLYQTQDGGAHWNKISTQRTGRPYATGMQMTDELTGMISLHPGAGPVEGGIMLTKDGGNSFERVGTATAVNQLQMLSAKEIWAACDGLNGKGFLIHSSDGGNTWKQSYPDAFPFARPTGDMSLLDHLNGFAVGTQLDSNQVLKTSDGGASWEIIATLKGFIRLEKVSYISEKEGYVLAYREKKPQHVLLETMDGGLTWKETPKQSLDRLDSSDIGYFRFFDRDQGVIYASGMDKALYMTRDGGVSWSKTKLADAGRLELKVAFTSSSEGWILREGDKKNGAALLRWSDGEPLQTVTTFQQEWFPEAVAFPSPERGFLLFEDFNKTGDNVTHLISTTNGGESWTDHVFPKASGLDFIDRLYFSDPRHGWMMSYNGMAETKDGGLSWTVLQ